MNTKSRIALLGCGLIGSAIARDLATDGRYRLTVADRNPEALEPLRSLPGVTGVVRDLREFSAVTELAAADLVINALPGFMGFRVLAAVIDCGTPVVDISFFPEDPLALDVLAREKGVTAVVDCGLAPGLSNLVLGRAAAEWDDLESFVCYVGGLPRERTLPFEYKIVFSIRDVFEEYTRPARVMENGRVVSKEALSDLENIEFPGVGTLEAFNTDGLRTLLYTLAVPEMKEKTLRYPGHAEKIRLLRETGFLGVEPVILDGLAIRPIDVTTALVSNRWKLKAGEEDLTVFRALIRGSKGGVLRQRRCELVDRYDAATGTTSMARTTGYTCAVTARLLLEGRVSGPGVVPPEFLGRSEEVYNAILDGLRRRGAVLDITESGRSP